MTQSVNDNSRSIQRSDTGAAPRSTILLFKSSSAYFDRLAISMLASTCEGVGYAVKAGLGCAAGTTTSSLGARCQTRAAESSPRGLFDSSYSAASSAQFTNAVPSPHALQQHTRASASQAAAGPPTGGPGPSSRPAPASPNLYSVFFSPQEAALAKSRALRRTVSEGDARTRREARWQWPVAVRFRVKRQPVISSATASHAARVPLFAALAFSMQQVTWPVCTVEVEVRVPRVMRAPGLSSGRWNGFALPVRGGEVSSEFGPRWGRLHKGIDLAARKGTPITAADSGTVVYSGWEPSYGRMIEVLHDDGWRTLYAHNDDNRRREGDYVRRGEEIATVGDSGTCTGPHLHFEVHQPITPRGIPCEPETTIRWRCVDPSLYVPIPVQGYRH